MPQFADIFKTILLSQLEYDLFLNIFNLDAYSRDVGYVVLVPDSAVLISGGARPPPPATPTERPAPSPMAPPSTPDHPPTPTAQQSDHEADGNSNPANAPVGSCISESVGNDDEEGNAPCIVVYLIEPCLGGDRRIACLAMLRSDNRTN
ncbi:uncharacterized protein LOC143921205 [Arctopsyche grandis]|uniref:uncharacterized protein LOC143921078 n=1 Tax=Arctopsyche grandis TaxID=121162 RepID=UPI00406D99BD